ncbi:TIGR03086 family metal-binding protein [Kitasatospora sp. NPDC101176]|uniref:TIGR03086 family metal-binding protein n=1 Tax=Kitasatospora sp. NPDC101176 TaxID=3364099 RepID=UPI003803EBAE
MTTPSPGEAGMRTDLRPTTAVVAGLVRGVRDDQLTAPTPCGPLTVGELLDHLAGLSEAFHDAAAKTVRADGGGARVPDATRLDRDWRESLPARLAALAEAWQPAGAWTGTATVGGGEMPAEVAGAAAIDEVLVHGWDLAVATGQRFPGDLPALAPAIGSATAWVRTVAEAHPDGLPGLFGPPVAASAATPMERLLTLTGRAPSWSPPPAA